MRWPGDLQYRHVRFSMTPSRPGMGGSACKKDAPMTSFDWDVLPAGCSRARFLSGLYCIAKE